MENVYKLIHIYLTPWYKKTANGFSFTKKYLQPTYNAFQWLGSNLIYAFAYRRSIISKENISGKTWLLVSSLNNRDSLSFVKEELEDSVFVSTGTWLGKNPIKTIPRLSFHSNLLYAYRLPFIYLKLFIKHGKFGLQLMDKCTEANGMLAACKRILKKGRPASLVFANDHNIKMRGLLLAAKELQIPTIYIQHASVSESFPPLEFDLAILEGEDAKNKYLKVGQTQTKIHLAGMPKFDTYLPYIKNNTTIQSIGICSNLLTELTEVETLVQDLNTNFPEIKIVYRAHPRDNRKISETLIVNQSNAKQEAVFDFLKTIDLLIAGETSTHLEAALLNIPSIQYAKLSSQQFDDYYGYIKEQLITKVNRFYELLDWIQMQQSNIDQPRARAQYFNATIGTQWDGKSKQLALGYLNDFLSKKQEPSA